MIEKKERKIVISFAHMGNYHIPISIFLNSTLKANVISPPPITRRTLELGNKYSPDFVCVPFKYNLGNFIEALENGATHIIQAGGGCRFGFYGELQEQILKDLGFDFKFYKSSSTFNLLDYYKILKSINPKINIYTFINNFLILCENIKNIDKIDDYIRENIGFEKKKGSMKKIYNDFISCLKKNNTLLKTKKNYKEFICSLKNIELEKTKRLKIGIIGELYTAMEPYSTFFLEEQLAKSGIEVKRFINLSYLLLWKPKNENKVLKNASDYIKYDLGADGTDSIANAIYLAKNNFDGIIHTKPFGCIPEVNAMPILQNISKDYNIPIMHLSFDTNTSETGIKTRIEAFCDMIRMRKDMNVSYE